MSELLDYYVCRTKQLEKVVKWYAVWNLLDKLFREVYAVGMDKKPPEEIDRLITYGRRLERKKRLAFERLYEAARINATHD
jgi:hypothetical protein